MHPNPLFRTDDRALMETLIDEIGFGMVFLTTPDGPRVAHTPILPAGDGAIRFHLSRGNALSAHLPDATALVTINGPDGYVSPRWYKDRGSVPTWDYVTLEMEGQVRQIDRDGLEAFLHALIEKHEARIDGDPWRAEETPRDHWNKLLGGIVGFEMEVQAWRPTLKLSQNKSREERETIATGFVAAGSSALARLVRNRSS